MSNAHVTFLGSGDAYFAGGRHQSGYLVETGDGCFLLDCGAATLAALKHHRISAGRIDTIFLSHLHGDHFSGIPFLILEYFYEETRKRPLRIAGPPGTRERVADLYRAMYSDLAQRSLPFELEFLEMTPGRRLEVSGITIDPFRVPHQEVEVSLGLRVEFDGRRILYSGDTGWTEELVRHSVNTDLFICECSFFETRLPIHLDYPLIMENRDRFDTGRLVLTHLGREVIERRNEIEIELASDGLQVRL